ncbi:MAG: V-type ATP synthase subunit E [Candidatus Diapherotrites archaeon]|uniref:A-type ATP synthase subunit E n=1 Tax=Candidatus Iainarchaeum sp. TaxID=3101447 RepID=A0A7J4ITE4_9ARCH|nr:MAG: V-type H+-transporting ATPase subunit E [archaeon GW2011_AR10]MBS3059819.1 V-type ATP synthase subunit E [Candidatus Diapherotrites archaeon]HIH08783.1 hypothetical protein [Candidatus Diapherotrites archaeon]
MSLEGLRKSLVQEAKAEARKMISQAEKEAAAITAAAGENAKKTLAQAKKRAEEMAVAERSEVIGAAQLRARRITSDARNELVEKALSEIFGEMVKATESEDYEKFMEKIITEAEKELGEKAVVFVSSKDKKIAKKISKNVAPEDAEISGGAIIRTKDGSVSIDSSLEAIFENNRENSKKVIFNELFRKGVAR